MSPKKFLCLILRKLKTTVFTQSVFTFCEFSYFSLKFDIKQSKVGWNFAKEWLPKAKIPRTIDDRWLNFFEKCTDFKLYEGSLEHKNFVKWKETQHFYSAIKVRKPFVVPWTCTRWNTKRGIGIIIFWADNYAAVKVVVHAEILPRDFLQILGNSYFLLTRTNIERFKIFHSKKIWSIFKGFEYETINFQ